MRWRQRSAWRPYACRGAGQGHVYLKPALVRVSESDQAQVEADYAAEAGTLDLQISTHGMDVGSLRAQAALAAVPWLEQLRSGQWSGQLHYRVGPGGEAGWTGKLSLSDAAIPVPGVAGLLRLESARAQIDRARVVLDRIEGAVENIAVRGEYRYEPQAARPHRVRLSMEEVDAADLEKQLAPTLRRGGSLIARALGRAALPDWLKSRGVEGTLRIGSLTAGGVRFDNVRANLLWDATRCDLNGIQAAVEGGSVTGKLAVNLRGARPGYQFTGRVKGLAWQAGRLDVEGVLAAGGTGKQLLQRLTSEGTFSGTGFDIGGPGPLRTAAGTYLFAMSAAGAKLRFTELELATAEETLTGRGETRDDGRLVLILSNGSREMRMSGTLAKLRMDETARQ